MWEFLTSGPNLPFTVALTVMLALAFIEGAGLLVGAGFSHLLDSLFPDLDMEIEGPNLDGKFGFSKILGWLYIGKVPMLVILIVFLTSFGLIGLLLQSLSESLLGQMLPAVVMAFPALLLSLPVVRVSSRLLASVIPKDETSAVSESSFIGRVAIITIGVARRGLPAQARLRDQHNQPHYVFVEPDIDGEEYSSGTAVLLVRRAGRNFRVIRADHASLRE
ncbi:MAG: YqiJ family protein [Opitutales bacterium]